ncbi:MAG: signal peptidase II [Armatimonadetes bacterium]|nr:signal peptidase II [Armatimonadota bacterium]
MRTGFWLLAFGVLALDQVTKQGVLRWLPEHHPPVPVLPGILYFTHIRNSGTAFGLLPDGGAGLTVMAVAAILCIVAYWRAVQRRRRPVHPLLATGLALPLGGAVGNLVDRIFLGQVVDFIDLRFWPVFNVADTAITVGAVLVGSYFFFIHDRVPAHEKRYAPGDG